MLTAPKHTISENGKTLHYAVRHSARAKRTAIRISPLREVELVVPKGIPFEKAEEFLRLKMTWILQKLSEIIPQSPVYRFQGAELRMTHSFKPGLKRHLVKIADGDLFIISPEGTAEKPRQIFGRFLLQSAKQQLPRRCKELAAQHGFAPAKITVRNQRSRWGSCSRRGTISLNCQLMQLSEPLCDYVIIHELCHLRHMNHSVRFWKEVENIIPDFREKRAALRVIKFA